MSSAALEELWENKPDDDISLILYLRLQMWTEENRKPELQTGGLEFERHGQQPGGKDRTKEKMLLVALMQSPPTIVSTNYSEYSVQSVPQLYGSVYEIAAL